MVSKLRKYWTVITTTWANGFAYPLSFWMWRFRQVIQTVVSLSLWESLFISSGTMFGYDRAQMLTYIFAANIVGFIVFASRTIDVSSIIDSGDLSLYLVRPVQFFVYWFSRDLADKAQNIIFSTAELTAIYFIFRPPLILPNSITPVVLTCIAVLGGVLLYYFVNMIFGFLGFWASDVWAPRFLFFTVMFFTSGSLFPLDIFPQQVVRIFSYTPFPYLVFFQTKLWLSQLPPDQIVRGFSLMILWIITCGILAIGMWKKGIVDYTAEGR
ncbi:MAG TPA: ABC-2 family transporter protein [Patescibacteria group bacterium]|nr:ABC-2 family transporter protein [Patescibacteria group bacterium]